MKLDYLGTAVVAMWMGQLVGEQGLALLSALLPWGAIFTWLLYLVPRGMASLISREVGGGGTKGTNLVASAALLQLLVGISLLALSMTLLWIGADSLAQAVGLSSPDVKLYGVLYLAGLFLFGVAEVFLLAVSATGNTRVTFVRSLFALVCLAALTPLLIQTIELGLFGPVVSELIFYFLLAALIIPLVLRSSHSLGLGRYRRSISLVYRWREILSIGAPAQISRVVGQMSFVVYFQMLSSEGTAVIAGFGVALRILIVVAVVITAWSQASAILYGIHLGAGRRRKCVKVERASAAGSMVIGTFSLLVFALFPGVLGRIFTSSHAAIAIVEESLGVIQFALVPFCFCQLWLTLCEARGSTGRASAGSIFADLSGLCVALYWDGGLEGAALGFTSAQYIKFSILGFLLHEKFIVRLFRARA